MKIVLQLTAADGTSQTVTIEAGQNFRVPAGVTVEIVSLDGVSNLHVESGNLVLSGPDGTVHIAGLGADFLNSTASVVAPGIDGPLPDGFLHLLGWGDIQTPDVQNNPPAFTDTTTPPDPAGSEAQPPLDYTDRNLGQQTPSASTPAITGYSDDTGATGDGITADTVLTLTGTADAGATVTIFDGGTELGTVAAATDGSWTFTTASLADGQHGFTAIASNAQGASPASPATVVTVDTGAPDAPVIATFSNDTSVASDGVTSDTTLTLSGTAEAGATVTVFDGATQLGTATANGGGAWSFDTAALGEGAHSFTASATDAAGNTGAASAALAVTIDTDAPEAPPIAGYASDTGTAGDGVTSDATLTLNGTAEEGATVTIFDDATELGTTVATGGAWSFDTAALGDGPHSFTATATDAAGNTGAASAAFSVTIDTTPSPAPTIDNYADDSGAAGDNITADTVLTLSGTAEAGATITIFDGATELGTAIATGGAWSFDTTALDEGAHNFTATATDAAGNVSDASATFTVTVDTAPPAAPAITGYSADTGAAGDGITSDTILTLSGTAEAGATITIFDGATELGTAIATGGAWSFDTAALDEGPHSFTATATDAAGNTGAASTALSVAIDTGLPDAPAITDYSTDTGAAGDGITSDTTLTLSGTAEAGATVTIYDGATELGTAVATGGAWTFVTTALDDGAHSFTATATDAAGNTGSASPAFSVTVDTAEPAAPVITGYSGDTGATGDGITSDTTLTLSGTAETGATVTIFDGATELGTAIATGGAWSFDTAALVEGPHSFTATATDAAGNTGTASSVFNVTVDTDEPSAPVITGYSDDSGATGDGITSDTTLTLSGTAETGATVTIYDGVTELGTAIATGGAWSFDTAALDVGPHSFTATATDAAGNTGAASVALAVAIDTGLPDAPAITGFAGDSGVSGDGITSDTTLTLSGTAEDGATVTIYDGATELGTAIATGGAWSFDTATLDDGPHSFTATATDAAGNTGAASVALAVAIDTGLPDAPAITGFAGDSGVAGDGITSDTTLTLSGTAEDGATVTIFDGTTELGTAIATGGAWSFDTATLDDGAHSFTATATDAAGNTGTASSVFSVTVDTGEPTAPEITGYSTDTGTPGDGITSDATLTLSGTAEANATVTIFDGATELGTVIATGGVWSFDTAALSEGPHSFTATATDAAGNTGAASATFSVSIDTGVPDAPEITGYSTDTGTVGDGITSDTTPSLSGTAEAGATVTIFDGATKLGTAIATGGVWSFDTSALSGGEHSFTATATDAAGNTGAASAALSITIDTSVPDAPAITGYAGDSGAVGDGITSDTTLILSGTAEAGATVTIFDGATELGTAIATGGVWSFDTAALNEGPHNFTATATSTSGNTGAHSPVFSVTVDTAPPAAPEIIGYSTDTGTAGDGITADVTLTLNGTGENGATVTIYNGVVEIGTAQVNAGTWSFTTATLPEGPQSFTATASDAAGNVSDASAAFAVTVDTTPPAAPTLTGFSSDTGTPGDSTTADNTITFSGAAEAGMTVNVYWGATIVASGVADVDGHWSATSTALDDGYYSFSARAADAAGNLGTPSDPMIVAVDTTPPAAPAISGYSSDTGVAGDGLTSDKTLTLSGTAVLGTTVSVYDGATLLGSVPVNAGTWSFTTAALDDGAHDFTAKAIDAAGNASDASTALTVTVDATPPATPAITAFSNDTGISGDGQTSDKTLTLTGTAGAGETVNVYDNGTLVASGVADIDGHWQATTDALSDGVHYLTARTVDTAGNLSPATPSIPIIVDTDAPNAPVIAAFSNDTGVTGDSLTSDRTITLTGTAERNATVTVYDGATLLGIASADSSGAWTFTTATLDEGAHSFTASATDVAGNTGALSGPLDITIDITPPAVPAITGFSGDSGVVGDGRTSDATLTFTGTAEAGITVNVYNGITLVATGTADGDGHWSATTDTLADTYYSFQARAVDTAGNASTASAPFIVIVDTTPPAAPVIASFANDNGIAGDHLTSDTTLTLSGTAEAGATVTIYDGATLLGTAQVFGGSWSFATAELDGGDHSFTATAVDAAGNVSDVSVAFDVTIDVTPPSVPTITGFSDNTGNPSDIYTSDNTITFTGTATAGDTVNVYWGATVIASGVADIDGHWSATAATIADSYYAFTARSVDAAGNVSADSAPVTIAVDTAPPSAPAITGFSDDRGLVGDHLTSDTTLTLSGTGESGARITILDGTTELGTATVNNGTWSFTTGVLVEGEHSFTATATDAAGNTGVASAAYAVTLDTTLPSVPVVTGYSNDTGVAGDGTTSDNTPTFTGTADAGSTVNIYWGGNVIASGIADETGHWSATSSTLIDGYYSLEARAFDPAGNGSAFVSAVILSIDTVPPSAPVITGFGDDTGTAGDGVTSDTTLTLSGTADGSSQVTIYDGATLLGTASVSGGAWNFTTSVLTSGDHSFTATANDYAGNVSDASQALVVTVDATLPATPVISGFSTDTGTVGDGQTSDTTLTFTGTADAGATVSVYWGQTIIASGVADISGNWSATSGTLIDGYYSVEARATNGGPSSAPSNPFIVTVDTTPPDAPSISGYSVDTGTQGDGITNDTTLAISGTADASKVAVYDGVTMLGTAIVNGGTWTFTTTTLTQGGHSFTAIAMDGAGNASGASSPLAVTIDTTPPAMPTISGSGGSTSDNTPTFSGTAEANITVNVYVNGTVVATGVADGDGNWSATAGNALDDGYTIFTARAVDVAGNLSLPSSSYILVIDTVPPAAPAITGFGDDTGVAGDGLTGDTTLRLTGTAETGTALVSVYDGATLLGAASVSNGSWSFDTSVLSQGEHNFTAIGRDFAGNTGDASSAFTVTIDTTPPAAPTISGSGGYTSDNTPTFTGTAEAGLTVNVYLGNTIVATGVADGDGNWSATAGTAIVDSYSTFQAKAVDAAGNLSLPSSSYSLFIDTVPPSTPVISSFSSDGGVVGDGITNDTTLDLTGTTDLGVQRVAIYDGASFLGNAFVNGGTWTFTTGTLTAGAHELTAKAIDFSGNASSASAPLNVTIDTTAPAKPTLDAMPTYLIDNTPTITGTAEVGTTVNVYLQGEVIATGVTDGTGHWSATVSNALPDAYSSFTARAFDVAGNGSLFSDPVIAFVDTVPPAVPSISGYSADSGVAGDFITSDKTLTLTGTAVAGTSTVAIYDGAALLGTAIVNSGTWTYTTAALGDGPHSLTVTARDYPGNESAATAPLVVTIDTASPAPVITGFSDDTGTAGDGITSDTTLLLSGTAEASSQVTIRDGVTVLGTATAGGDGAWTFATATLTPGSHSFTATALDVAGNTSTASSPLAVTIQDGALATPVITGFSDDTGVTGDRQTSDNTLTFTGTGTAGATVEIVSGVTVIASGLVDGTGHWSATSDTLIDGAYSFTARVTDGVNQSGASSALAVTIDTAPPAAPIISGIATDTGTAGDGITSDTTLTLAGTAAGASSVSVYDGATLLGTATVSGGSWSFDTATLVQGGHAFTATASDAAGNVSSASSAFNATIDTAAPAAPVIDAGGYYLNDSTPTITGTADVGSTVNIYLDGFINLIATAVADETGHWSATPANAISEASHYFVARAVDTAGNVSGQSNLVSHTVDTVAPNAPTLDAFSADSGVVGDGITRNTYLTLTGTAAAGVASLSIYDGATLLGTAYAIAGNWSFSTSTLTQGDHSFTAKAVDYAGNLSDASSPLVVTIDTTPPARPVIDVGGYYLNDNTPTITGTAVANTTVNVYVDGNTLIATTTSDGTGHWSVTASTALSDAYHSFTAASVDAAGNMSNQSDSVGHSIDTVAPDAPVISAFSSDSGTVGDGITSATFLTLSGTVASGSASVAVYDGATLLGTGSINGTSWSFFTPTLSPGTHNFTATATDYAGNVGALSSAFAVTIDTAPPATPTIDAFSGYVSDTTPTFTGTAEAGVTVNVYQNTTVVASGVADGDGHWSATVSSPMAEGYQGFIARALDNAGNQSGAASVAFFIDTLPPAAPVITGFSDDTGTPGDSITRDTTLHLTGTVEGGTSQVSVYDGATYLGTAFASGTTWTYDTSPLSQGLHHLTATALDYAGNASAPSAQLDVTIDTTAPAAPAFTSVGGTVADNTPTFTGTGEIGSTVHVLLGSATIATGIVDGTGHWTATPSTPVAEGYLSFDAQAFDDAGNPSTAATPVILIVDTIPPAAPAITGISDSVGLIDTGHTAQTFVTLQGTTDIDASRIDIYDGATLLGSTVASGGSWSYMTGELSSGEHDFTATAKDSAGNVSASSPNAEVTLGAYSAAGTAADDSFTTSSPIGSIDGQGGTDTLHFNGASLSSVDLGGLHSIEHIDLNQGTAQSLSLSAADVLNISEDIFGSSGNETTRLTILGDSSDSVTATGSGWTNGGTQTVEGVAFNVFDNGHAQLLVQSDVATHGLPVA
ncbi:MAG: hypothetical protein K8R18_12860 [Parvibaculum sp.]|uniref:Ig-like domain-containing protein n=1 Tax=Parvibaculum sp. TaxID=2024848 RepID=UPI0025F0C3C8|nr:Ig-like domain-containing protein [Parvibaculum sp.]MCE9650505.1 hypothetical protein [Parvibaculum sp.]